MAYPLNSMSEEFFYAPGEPVDAGPTVNSKGEPVSLYSAIANMPSDELAELAQLIDVSPNAEDFIPRLVDMARETDTTSNIDSPTEVWIDADGDFRVFVYDAD